MNPKTSANEGDLAELSLGELSLVAGGVRECLPPLAPSPLPLPYPNLAI